MSFIVEFFLFISSFSIIISCIYVVLCKKLLNKYYGFLKRMRKFLRRKKIVIFCQCLMDFRFKSVWRWVFLFELLDSSGLKHCLMYSGWSLKKCAQAFYGFLLKMEFDGKGLRTTKFTPQFWQSQQNPSQLVISCMAHKRLLKHQKGLAECVC